jgi:allophanate hydrolase subunit 1
MWTTRNFPETDPEVKMTAFWDIVSCSLVEVDVCFRDVYCFRHQGDELAYFYKTTTISQKALIFIHAAIRT